MWGGLGLTGKGFQVESTRREKEGGGEGERGGGAKEDREQDVSITWDGPEAQG